MLQFHEDRATQAAGQLLKLSGGSTDMLKLVKLLYLLDREALSRWGRPVTTDSYCSMEHGTVVSTIYDIMKAKREAPYWNLFIERAGNTIALKSEPPDDQLSDAHISIIKEIWAKFGHMTAWELRNYTHSLKEWRDPGKSSLPIQIEEILSAVGWDEDEILATIEDLRALQP